MINHCCWRQRAGLHGQRIWSVMAVPLSCGKSTHTFPVGRVWASQPMQMNCPPLVSVQFWVIVTDSLVQQVWIYQRREKTHILPLCTLHLAGYSCLVPHMCYTCNCCMHCLSLPLEKYIASSFETFQLRVCFSFLAPLAWRGTLS